jgi:hypothetical protein
VFCLKVEYYLDNNKQLERSDAAKATAMDQHAESVFDFLDKAEKDKTPMRLKLMGIDVTLDENRCSSARRVRKPRLAVQQT